MERLINEERLLASLQEELTRFTVDVTNGQPKTDIMAEVFREFAREFEDVIGDFIAENGEVGPKDMFALCAALEVAQQSIADRLSDSTPDHILRRVLQCITASRQGVRREVEACMDWRSKKAKRQEVFVKGVNYMLKLLGEDVRVQNIGTYYFSADEQRVCLWCLQYLGSNAAADYMRAVYGKRLGRRREKIQNLRAHLGDIQVRGGNPIVDVPVPLLTLPALGCLRELFFNKMRDKVFEEYYLPARKEEGVEPALAYIRQCRSEAGDLEREKFADELIAYYEELETETKTPSRLRASLDENGEFPAKHQRVVMLEMKRKKRILNADPTGAGKTGAFIASFEKLRDEGKANRALIVCPTEVIQVWEKALSCQQGGCFRDDLPPAEQPKVVIIPTGSVEEKRRAWEHAKTANYVITTNVRLRSHKRHPDYNPVVLANEIGADCMCADEGHNYRNPKGKDTDNIFQISQCDSMRKGYLYIGTATPTYNTVQDNAALIRLLYTGEDGAPKNAGLKANVKFENIGELARALAFNRTGAVRNLLHLRMLRRNLEHCLPVGTPLERESAQFAQLQPWERIQYEAYVEYPFKEGSEAVQVLSRLCLMSEAKFQQTLAQIRHYLAESQTGKVLGGHTGLAEGVTRFNGTNEEADGNIDRYMAGRIRDELKKDNVSTYIIDGSNTGSKPLTDDEGNLLRDLDNAFLTKTRQIFDTCRQDPRKSFLLLLAETCGEGISLTFCDREFFIAPSTVKPKEVQMTGRVHRRGQRHPVKRTSLVLKDTIEQGKMDFAERKYAIICKLLDDGEPLTQEEVDIVMDDVRRVNNEGFLAYETMSPKQKLMFIFNRIFSAGKQRVREFFGFDGGRYAKELSQFYLELEDLSTAGNNRRLLLSLLQKNLPAMRKKFGRKVKVADIASGPMALAHSLHHEKNIEVHSSDICKDMLDVGKHAYAGHLPPGSVKECAMDELPYPEESMHVAFLSLALQYTKHNPRRIGKGGDDRLLALEKLNGILAKGGRAYIALPHHLFDTPEGEPNQRRLEQMYSVLEDFGGFRVVREESGRAHAAEDTGDRFATYMVALDKVGSSRIRFLPPELWSALHFHRARTSRAKGGEGKKREKIIKPPPQGAFHERFILGSQELTYAAPSHEEKQNSEHRANKYKYQRATERIRTLIAQHGSIDAIPTEQLLSISLEEVDIEEQTERDLHCLELLEQHGGRIEKIPIQELAQFSPVILVRGKAKKGSFLCLANIADAKKHPTGGYGKRFFDRDEFIKQPEA